MQLLIKWMSLLNKSINVPPPQKKNYLLTPNLNGSVQYTVIIY